MMCKHCCHVLLRESRQRLLRESCQRLLREIRQRLLRLRTATWTRVCIAAVLHAALACATSDLLQDALAYAC